MLHSPLVYILDEPASGLDPLARRELRATLRRLAGNGATIFISSHILTELSEMCTSLCVMNRGRLLASGSVDEVRHQLGDHKRQLTATLLAPLETPPHWLSVFDGIGELQLRGNSLTFSFHGSDEQQAHLLEEFLRQGLRVRSFEEKRSSYEEILIGVAEKNITP